MYITLSKFGGEAPKAAAHLLDSHMAQVAINCMLARGHVQAYRAPLKDSALTLTAVKSLYRYDENTNENWVVANEVRHYVKSLIAGDTYERVYFTGAATPRFFANDNVSGGGFDETTDFYKLGIPAPTTAPTIGSAGGGATYEGYVYSFVNSYGDEGPPSPVGSITDYNAGNITVDDIEAAPTDRAIDKIYVYRTNASGTGTAEFQFVLEATWFSAAVDYVVGDFVIYATDLYKCTTNHPHAAWNAGHFTAGDDVADADLLAVFPKTNFDPPPDDLAGLIALANGSLAGFDENTLYFSEPYYPHAWPTDYTIGFDAAIIGIGVDQSTITVVTVGQAYTVSGSHPTTMAKTKISSHYPGLTSRNVISCNGGTSWLAKEGLIAVGAESITNITEDIMLPDDMAEYDLDSTAMYFFQNKYFGFDATNETGFIIDLINDCYVPLSIYAHAAYVTPEGDFYLVMDDTSVIDEDAPPVAMPLCVSQWEGDDENYLQYVWRSKEFITSKDVNFSIARVILDQEFYDAVYALLDLTTLNAATFAAGLTGALGIDGSLGGGHELAGDEMITLGDLSISPYVAFRLYADGELKFTKTLSVADTKFRLPGGFLSNRHYFELAGFIPVKHVSLATSADELT